jgi:hypothetical protein
MEKLVYLLWGEGTPESGDFVRAGILSETAPRLEQLGGRGITMNVHDAEAAKAPSPVPSPAG